MRNISGFQIIQQLFIGKFRNIKSAVPMSIINEIFNPIYGKPCWQVKQGYGSFLTFEFGEPHLDIRGPRQASEQATEKVKKIAVRRHMYLHGDWHLWIYLCNWRILLKGQEIANHALNRRIIKNAIMEVDGQVLTQVNVNSSIEFIFEFDLGGRLEVAPNNGYYGKTADLWLLYEPSGNVFTLRTDGQYCHKPGDHPPDEKNWEPLAKNHEYLSES